MSRDNALVSAEWLEKNLDTPGITIIETGEDDFQYASGHIPGAVWIDWKGEFLDQINIGVVDREGFSNLMSAKGISNEDTVVVYAADCNLRAASVYWYFTLYGHHDVRMLDGGRARWELDGRPLTGTSFPRTPTSYQAQEADMSVRAMRDDVVEAIGRANLVDVRTADEYCGNHFSPGQAPHELSQRAGRIPGALHLPWKAVANKDDETFKSDEEIRRLYTKMDVNADTEVIAYCWVGARSAHTWFVLHELLDYPKVKNYDGSWSEYGSSIGVPIETGSDPRSKG